MNQRNRKIGVAATLAVAAGAILANPSPASAWDDLPCGSTEATAHLCAPGEVARNGTIPNPLPPPVVVVPPPAIVVPPPANPVEALPLLVPSAPRKVTRPQKPRPTCALLRRERAGVLWLVRFKCRTRLPGPFNPAVAGEYRRAQGPSPATIVERLLTKVPQLAGDTPYASSIQQGAGGRSASGGVSATERGRLVPLGIPGHPWTSKSTAPHRGVAVSASWRSGRVTVSVVYSASRGRSSTSVSAR